MKIKKVEFKNFASYGNRLQIIDFEEDKSNLYLVLGGNGAGKSTLAHAIMANPKYNTSGGIVYNDTALDDLATWERAQLGLFISFQNPTPIEGLSNFRLIKEAMDMGTTSSIMDKLNGFRGLAKELNLPEGWDKKELNVEASGGEKKKNELSPKSVEGKK